MRAAAASNSADVPSAARLSPSKSLRGAAAAGAAAAGASPLMDGAFDGAFDGAPEGAADERGVRPAAVGDIIPAVGAVLRLRLLAERPLAEPRSAAGGLIEAARSRGAPAPRTGVACGVAPAVLRRPFFCASAPPLAPPPLAP